MSETTVLRRFNRSYTQRIGALEDSFLGLGMPLAPARLLFEIGTAEHQGRTVTVRTLRERNGLDSGYLSRLLRLLEDDGYIVVDPDQRDRRRRVVRLTEKGRETWDVIEQRSEERAHLILDPLTPRQRERLTGALATADLLVRAATVTFETVDPAHPHARTAVGHYFAELEQRLDHRFDPGPHRAKDDDTLRAPHGQFVVAVSDGDPVACGGLRDLDGAAEIKRMWVDDQWRGAGLGSRLLRHLEALAVARGHVVIRLDTNESLVEAIAMYERAGYATTARYNDNPHATHFFEKLL